MMRSKFVVWGLLPAAIVLLHGCARRQPDPVDIFPEDICTLCKMAISDRRFASEILTAEEVFKFDDIGCMEKYRGIRGELRDIQVFYMDYTTRTWLPEQRAVVVRSGVFTPMGSGMVAFADSTDARAFANDHPAQHSGE